MGRLAYYWLAVAGIITAVSGCDNVSWGEFDVRLVRAAPPLGAVSDSVPEPEVSPPTLPDGAVLFLGRIGNRESSIVALAELSGDSLLGLPTELDEPGFLAYFSEQRLSVGTRFTLFADGARVGTFMAGDSVFVDRSTCLERPAVSGIVELVPGVSLGSTFLAMPEALAAPRPHESITNLESTYDQRVASLDLAGSVITRQNALWPPSLLESRKSLRIIDLPGTDDPTVATTFVHLDGLGVGPAPARSYSIFMLVQNRGTGYRSEYEWFRDYDREGKAAPRYLTRLDGDLDGSDEVFLEAFGSESRWIAALGARADGWQMIYEDACTAAPAGSVLPPQ